MKIEEVTHISTLIDIVTFLSTTVLIWGLDTTRTVPLQLSYYTLDFIVNGLPLQISNSGAALLYWLVLGIVYTAIFSAVVVFVFRRIRGDIV